MSLLYVISINLNNFNYLVINTICLECPPLFKMNCTNGFEKNEDGCYICKSKEAAVVVDDEISKIIILIS